MYKVSALILVYISNELGSKLMCSPVLIVLEAYGFCSTAKTILRVVIETIEIDLTALLTLYVVFSCHAGIDFRRSFLFVDEFDQFGTKLLRVPFRIKFKSFCLCSFTQSAFRITENLIYTY